MFNLEEKNYTNDTAVSAELVQLLNADQRQVFDTIEDELIKKKTIGRLVGYAGVGKTFIMQALSEKYGRRVIFSAPTNKAVKVLKEKIKNSCCMTVHKLLGIIVKQGRMTPTGAGQIPPVSEFDLWVIDESSMVGNELFKLIKEHWLNFGGTSYSLLFVGDNAQIVPVEKNKTKKQVEELVSPVFKDEILAHDLAQDQDLCSMRLNTIVRQAEGNPIIALSKEIRTNGVNWDLIQKYQDGKNIIIMPKEKFTPRAKDFFLKDGVVLAYTNRTVDSWNEVIHKQIYGENAPKFVKGQTVIAGGPLKNNYSGKGEKILGDNGQEYKVLKDVNWNCAEVSVRNENFKVDLITLGELLDNKSEEIGDINSFYLLNKNSEEKMQNVLKKLEAHAYDAMQKKYSASTFWGAFYEIKEFFADIRHPYAMTAHKAQGSTYERVAIDYRDVMSNQKVSAFEKQKLLYVMLTRASKLAVFLC